MGMIQAIQTTNSGLQYNGSSVAAHAHNIANVHTKDYTPSRVDAISQAPGVGGGVHGVIAVSAQVNGIVDATEYAQHLDRVDLAKEYTSILRAKQAYSANLTVTRGIDDLLRQIPGLAD